MCNTLQILQLVSCCTTIRDSRSKCHSEPSRHTVIEYADEATANLIVAAELDEAEALGDNSKGREQSHSRRSHW